jgi:PPOX class probable F420-dependent enzyme
MDANNVDLEKAKYVSLVTFRKSGAAVATPVWAAFQDGGYYVFSAGNAGKVKRLKNSSQARLAVCGARGELKGPWYDARAEILDAPEDIERALGALRHKDGCSMWVADVLSRISGRMNRRVYLRVQLNSLDSDRL